ncbi:hypothetical protein BDV96DRAFT_639865 [Lophiotrema nucula]|uniref:Polynucleotide 5'-hydroxyl-kinase GRC3 n=1 Tax=Lophiotrema nucula TaxID=690887 RepID=A0A6A5ZTX3_9PLEO|nr:hypothetical protein BDV96DRAFT_639865 [Lophiotrema nucula]
MPGKRKRQAGNPSDFVSSKRPISAIAAAKLRAQQVTHVDGNLEASPGPLSVVPESDAEEIPFGDHVQEAQRNPQLCNWRNEQKNVISESEDQLTIALSKNSTVSFIGCYRLTVLKGAVNVNGANLASSSKTGQTATSYLVYAASPCPIPSIRGLDHENQIQVSTCREPTQLADICPLFADIWSGATTATESTSFKLVRQSSSDLLGRPLYPLLAPEDWLHQIEECATHALKTIIIGPPSTGKSTFARRLLNRYLTGFGRHAKARSLVYYLDLDNGSQEYGPNGIIALYRIRQLNLGPSFTHSSTLSTLSGPYEIVRSHPLPIRGLRDHKDHFEACVEDLMQTFKASQHRVEAAPLIINTPGKTFASDIANITRLLSLTRPQRCIHVADLEATQESGADTLVALTSATAASRVSYHQVSAQKPLNNPSHSESELQSMKLQSYFHCIGQEKIKSHQLVYDAKPLSHKMPWDLHYEDTEVAYQSFIGFMLLSEWSSPNQLQRMLNGAIVQVVSTTDVEVQNLLDTIPRTNKYRIPYFEKSLDGNVKPLDPKLSNVVCTAMIRGFDPERRVIQLLVPETYEDLLYGLEPKSTVLVGGCCETPEWAFTEGAYSELSRQKHNTGDAISSPWVATSEAIEEMGYLNTARRVRKYHQ